MARVEVKGFVISCDYCQTRFISDINSVARNKDEWKQMIKEAMENEWYVSRDEEVMECYECITKRTLEKE